MPELPEVETVRRGLERVLLGRRITAVQVLEPKLRCPVADDFACRLKNGIFEHVERRGKYLLLQFEGRKGIWVVHLGMSGKLIYVASARPRERHDHIIVTLDNGHELRYHDPRRFGFSAVVARSRIEQLPQLSRLGVDPLGADFHCRYLYAAARTSRRPIRDLLMDQSILAGLGNIYANEVLFQAGIRPSRRAHRLSRSGIQRIAEAIPRILAEAILARGTSFSDYRDGEDRKGDFQRRLRVYAREGEGCSRCGVIIKRIVIGNRSGFYCPGCQP